MSSLNVSSLSPGDVFCCKQGLTFEESLANSATKEAIDGIQVIRESIIRKHGYVDPKSYKSSQKRAKPEALLYEKGCIEEVDYFIDQGIARPEDRRHLPYGTNILPFIWILHAKFLLSGILDRVRCRLAPQGCFQQVGKDYVWGV